MINGGPDPLFVKAMVVPSREVVVPFSPVDFTVRPPEYRITSDPNTTIARITTSVIRFIDPPVSSLTVLLQPLRLLVVPGLGDRGQVSGEVFQGLRRAGVDAHLEQSVAIAGGRALNRHRQLRFLPILGEDERRSPEQTAENELFRRDDFPINAGERVSLATVRSAVHPAKGAVRPQIDFADSEWDTARVPPVCDVFGLSPGLEHNRPRRIEETCHHDLAVTRSRNCDGPDVIH